MAESNPFPGVATPREWREYLNDAIRSAEDPREVAREAVWRAAELGVDASEALSRLRFALRLAGLPVSDGLSRSQVGKIYSQHRRKSRHSNGKENQSQ